MLFVGLAATSCTTASTTSTTGAKTAATVKHTKVTYNYTAKDRDCLKRAMYFESEHSDHDGYMAVGSVVMNRLTSGAYPPSICGIVAQEKQFAPGVMTREVKAEAEPDLETAATALLRGDRHPGVKDAMFFHTEGLRFHYDNMHYVTVAGGNAFYEKRAPDGSLETPEPLPAYEVAMNYVPMQTMTNAPFPLSVQASTPYVPAAAPAPAPYIAAVAPDTIPYIPEVVPVPTPSPETASNVSAPPAIPVVVPLPRPAHNDTAALGRTANIGG